MRKPRSPGRCAVIDAPDQADAQGRITRWFGTNTDVAAQVVAEASLRELNETLEQRVVEEVAERAVAEEKLRQSQKMEAVSQLTGGLAHDFNNLLQDITGSLELLQAHFAQGRLSEADRYINAAQGAAKRPPRLRTGCWLSRAGRRSTPSRSTSTA